MTDNKQPHKGILKNAHHQPESDSTYSPDEFDRDLVAKNTRLNRLMTSGQEQSSSSSIGGTNPPPPSAVTPSAALSYPWKDDEGHLHWDEANIFKTEQERTATMKITEPKTPFAGTNDPVYYGNNNNNNNNADDIPEISLGENDIQSSLPVLDQNNRIVVDELAQKQQQQQQDKDSDEQQQEQEEDASDKHKRFEQLRRKHYHLEGKPTAKLLQQDQQDSS